MLVADTFLYIAITLTTILSIANTKSIGDGSLANANQINDNRVTSTQNNLHENLMQLNRKYQNTLTNKTLLPFVSDCTFVYNITSSPTATQSTPSVKQSRENLLCLVYFDMVNNLGKSGFNDYQTEASVIDTLTVYDNDTLVSHFCNLFGAEIPMDEDKRPFETTLMPKRDSWKVLQNRDACNQFCMYLDDNTFVTRIKPVCKLVSGGYRSWKRHLIDHDTTPAVQVGSKLNVTETGGTAVANQPAVAVVVPEKKPEADGTQAQVEAGNDIPLEAEKPIAGSLPEEDHQAAIPPAVEAPIVVDELKAVDDASSPNALVNASNPKLTLSSTTNVNQTTELAVVPNDKTSTKEMKSSPKEEPAVNEETEDKNLDIQADADDDEYPGNLFSYSIHFEQPSPSSPNLYLPPLTFAFTFTDNDKTEKESVVQKIPDGSAKLINPDADEDETLDDEESLQKPDDDGQAQKEVQPNAGNHNMRNDKPQIAVPEKQVLINNHVAEFQNDPFSEDKNSSFFSYFMFMLLVCATLYVVYHNKTKVMALLVEGRRSRAGGSRDGRRKHRAAYRKLDTNLEEAIQSSGKVGSSQIIY